MPLSLIPGSDPPLPVRLDSLRPGDGFYIWWANDRGRADADAAGVVLRVVPGYVKVRVRYKDVDVADFVDGDGKAHYFEAAKVKETEWSRGTLVVKEESMANGEEQVESTDEAVPYRSAKAAARKSAASLKPPKTNGKAAKSNGKAKKVLGPNEGGACWCGCGETVTRRFKPGHDARFYSQLKKVIDGDMKFTALSKPAQKELGDIKGVKSAYAAHSGRA